MILRTHAASHYVLAFFGITEQFLGKCLGGRAEALGDDVRQSSAKVEEGAGLIPGLPAATAAGGGK